MERRTTGSWVQCANRFGEISLRLSPHAGGERTAQRIGQHKYIGGAYKILGRLGEATLVCLAGVVNYRDERNPTEAMTPTVAEG